MAPVPGIFLIYCVEPRCARVPLSSRLAQWQSTRVVTASVYEFYMWFYITLWSFGTIELASPEPWVYRFDAGRSHQV